MIIRMPMALGPSPMFLARPDASMGAAAGVPATSPSATFAAQAGFAGTHFIHSGVGPANPLFGGATVSGGTNVEGNDTVPPSGSGGTGGDGPDGLKNVLVTHIGKVALAASISAERLHPFLVGKDGGLLLPSTFKEMMRLLKARYGAPEKGHFDDDKVQLRINRDFTFTHLDVCVCVVFHAGTQEHKDYVRASYYYSRRGRLLQVFLDDLKFRYVSIPMLGEFAVRETATRSIAEYTPGKERMPKTWQVADAFQNLGIVEQSDLKTALSNARDALLLLADMPKKQFNAVVSPEGTIDSIWLRGMFHKEFIDAVINHVVNLVLPSRVLLQANPTFNAPVYSALSLPAISPERIMECRDNLIARSKSRRSNREADRTADSTHEHHPRIPIARLILSQDDYDD